MAFWQRKPLHERLAREGGLVQGPPPRAAWDDLVGIHGIHRQRQWDAVVTAKAEVGGDELLFVGLPDGSLLLEEGGAGDLTPLAAAVEAQLSLPYRATAVRRDGDVWAVAARRIEVVELEDDPGGDQLELAWDGSERTYRVDGEPSFGGVRALERLAEQRFETWAVRASRLDGGLWEVTVAPL